MPSFPYTVDNSGFGPAWGNSLFEDAAEYGYGIHTAITYRRKNIEKQITDISSQSSIPQDFKNTLDNWLKYKDEPTNSFMYGQQIIKNIDSLIDNNDQSIKDNENLKNMILDIKDNSDLLGKISVWIMGGDGWAYDIDYGGLDHVLASGENIKVLVLDTECYSNTGGQTSKATPLGAVTKFSSSGKRTNRKELGRMFMVYNNVYVASIAMGANKQQTIDALTEAENYDGPAIVIAYCPCINHGIKKGMGTSIVEEANAVASGYWPLFRYNPDLAKQGKDPFILDYGEPNGNIFQYLDGEDRYADLVQRLPELAKQLQQGLKDDCDLQYKILKDNVTDKS